MSNSEWILIIQTVVILIAGLVTLIIYFLNNKNQLKTASRIILSEIRASEKSIDILKKLGPDNIAATITLSTSRSWNYYKHLFVDNLDSDEHVLLENFYSRSDFAEKARLEIFSFHSQSLMQRALYIQIKLIDFATEATSDTNNDISNCKDIYNIRKKRLQDIVHEEEYWFLANHPKNIFKDSINAIPNITSTTAGQKLKKLARQK